MAVAPFLPRTGVPYIPRPPLAFYVAQAGAGAVNITVDGVTTNRDESTVTLRVFDPNGVRVHELQELVDESDDEAVFSGVTIATPGPHRVVAMTSLGQVGRAIVSTAAPPPPLSAGTEHLGDDVPNPPPQYPIVVSVYVQGTFVGTPTSAILTVNGTPRASEPVTLSGGANDIVSVDYSIPASGTYNFVLTLNNGQSGTPDPLVMLPVA